MPHHLLLNPARRRLIVMKIALIIPNYNYRKARSFYEYKFISRFLFTNNCFSYPLAIPTLAAITPPRHQVRIFDENLGDIDYGWKPDLAAITAMTMSANRAYAIADVYRSYGVKTVMGGIHPSMCTEEALLHCDAVVSGEAEGVWHTLLNDAEEDNMKTIYQSESKGNIQDFLIPDRTGLLRDRYFTDILQTTKGCPFQCEFCSVHAYDGSTIRNKTVKQVLDDIKGLHGSSLTYKKKAIFFADDNIIANKHFAIELFTALKPYKIKWSCQASINVSREGKLLKLMKESGCGSMLIGLESISGRNLSLMSKGVNLRHDYLDAIRRIQSHGIRVDGSFILGYDFDTQASFDELIAFIEEARMLMPLINILTPFPGTKLFGRFEADGRILHKDWSTYDTKTVVFKHPAMSARDLEDGFVRVLRQVYSFESMYRKLKYYWKIDFWQKMNEDDPIKLRYRLLFALRLITLLLSSNINRSIFILKILPRIFSRRVRLSTVLSLMAYNDYAYSEV